MGESVNYSSGAADHMSTENHLRAAVFGLPRNKPMPGDLSKLTSGDDATRHRVEC